METTFKHDLGHLGVPDPLPDIIADSSPGSACTMTPATRLRCAMDA